MSIEPRNADVRPGIRRLFRLASRSNRMARGDADAELESFLDERTAHLIARGMPAAEAQQEALRRLGARSMDEARVIFRHSAQQRERRLSMREFARDIARDIRYAIRGILDRPVFAFSVVVTLAVGIGAATSVFGIINGVLLKTLPYPEPQQIVRIFETAPPAQGGELRSIAIPTLDDWRKGTSAFSDIALFGPSTYDLSGEDHAEQVQGTATSAALFTLLRVRPSLGRTFAADEEVPGGPLVVVLSHRLWQQRYGGDSSIIGRTVRIDRKSYTVIGVMPATFAYPVNSLLWTPIGTDHEFYAREARHMSGIGRLRAGISLEAATSQLMAVEAQLAQVYPKIYKERGIRLIPLDERVVGNIRPILRMLGGAVVLVLLIACANVANLLLARGTARRREVAIRLSLGGSRARVARQLFTETALLFLIAGAAGVTATVAVVRMMHALPPEILPRAESIQVEWPVLLFALMATACTSIVFGLLPALRTSNVAPGELLADVGRGATGARRGERMRAGLIVLETAMAAVLLVGAGLLTRSIEQLRRVDTAFDIDRVMAFDVSLPSDKQSDNAFTVAFFRQLRDRVAEVPGVMGVGMSSRLPLSGEDHSNSFRLASDPVTTQIERSAQDRAISAGYFKALGVAIRKGREFSDADGPSAQPVIIVNEAFATKYLPRQDAIGQRIVPSRAGGVPREIVGVVADTRQGGLDTPAEPEFYIPHAQDPWPFLSVVVRADGDPLQLLPAVRSAVAALDPEMALGNVRTIAGVVAASGAQRRIIALTIGSFALIAYLLAAIGLYGIVAYAVAERTPEIGVRVALGAQRLDIVRIVVWRGLSLAIAGAVVGLAAALPLSGIIRGQLYGVASNDPVTFAVVSVLLPLVAIVASLIPTRRALKIEPMSAMRGS